MKKKTANNLLIIAGVAVAAAAAFYFLRERQSHKVKREVSDEGYETAEDLLYPNKRRGSSKVHYGPVLPNN